MWLSIEKTWGKWMGTGLEWTTSILQTILRAARKCEHFHHLPCWTLGQNFFSKVVWSNLEEWNNARTALKLMIEDRDCWVHFPHPLGTSSCSQNFLALLFWSILIFKDIRGRKLLFFHHVALVLLDYGVVEVLLISSILWKKLGAHNEVSVILSQNILDHWVHVW